MDAERTGRWGRADFFWRETHATLRRLSDQPKVWQDVSAAITDETDAHVMRDPVQLRQRLVDEILIDTHRALFNGLSRGNEQLALGDRAFVHLDYLKDLLPFSGRPREHLHDLVAPPLERRIALSEAAEKWQSAIADGRDLLTLFPESEDHQNRLAGLHFAATLASLKNGTSRRRKRKDADVLRRGIAALEQLHREHPTNSMLFGLLAHLHRLRAITMANAGRLAEALVAAQTAVTFDPSLAEAWVTRAQLMEAMQQLRTRMESIEADLARRRNARLNRDGQRLRAEAREGFHPFNRYAHSAEAAETSRAARLARALALWKDTGLAESPDQRDERAMALLGGLDHLLRQPPADPADVADAWERVVEQDPGLAELDRAAVLAFLERRLFGGAEAPTPTKPSLPVSDLPALAVASTRRRSTEPILDWLFSHQDRRVKLQATVALVLILSVAGLTIDAADRREARDVAYRQVAMAAATNDDLQVIEAAEVFLAARPRLGTDGREQQVQDLYSEAFVRWFVQQSDQPESDVEKHVERYRALAAGSE
jgi:tetratricopeptide (TPR) repeat protein